ncbi:MAG: hypothetical protein IKJ65_04040 [Clostridia bacterium]|nr:hypothetical protein [Clostridia bacterium]
MKVLFIGNSHTYYNDMPALFKRLCAENGKDVHVTMLTKGGMGLDYHAKQEQTRFNILYGGYDAVVLQHTAHPMGDLDEMRKGAETICAWCRQAQSRVVLYQTWTKKGDEKSQEHMSKVYFDLGALLGADVAPVGDVWQKTRIEQPELELYFTDGAHASSDGSALAARVIFETLFK